MHIPLTQEQYKTLLLMVYLGDWMINAIRPEPDEDFQGVACYIYSFAETFGIAGLIGPEPYKGKKFPSREFDKLAQPYIRQYDNQIFWEELADRLAERDFVAHYGRNAIEGMSPEERFAKRSELTDRYLEEFERNGLDRVAVNGDLILK